MVAFQVAFDAIKLHVSNGESKCFRGKIYINIDNKQNLHSNNCCVFVCALQTSLSMCLYVCVSIYILCVSTIISIYSTISDAICVSSFSIDFCTFLFAFEVCVYVCMWVCRSNDVLMPHTHTLIHPYTPSPHIFISFYLNRHQFHHFSHYPLLFIIPRSPCPCCCCC